jgi:DNA invertase Pin-like site-specific DNA recombinase
MNTKVIQLVRVSTNKQDYQRQINDLSKIADRKNWNVVKVIAEKISGATKNEDREGIQILLDEISKSSFDKLMVSEISRLGRSPLDVMKVLDELHKKNISVFVADLNFETLDENGKTSFQTELLTQIMTLFSKKERETTIERIKSGMQKAKKDGKRIGRQTGESETIDQFKNKYKNIIPDIKLGLSVRKLCKLHGIAQNTILKLKRTIEIQVA